MRLIADDVWATLTIWSEARGEPQAGRIGVAEVLRNRTEHRLHSSGSVASTCLRPYQFSCWNTKDPNRIAAALLDDADPLVLACAQAWATAVAGSDTTLGALFYYAPASVPVTPDWVQDCELACRIGRHEFYRVRRG